MIQAALLMIRRAYWRQQVAKRCRELSAYANGPTIRPEGWRIAEVERLQRRAIAAQEAYGRTMARYSGRAAA